jgi:hypothetical protein
MPLAMCCMKQRLSGAKCKVITAAKPGLDCVACAIPNGNSTRKDRVRSEYCLPTPRFTTMALFLALSPTLAWSQATDADKPSAPPPKPLIQQPASSDAAAQPDGAGELQLPAAPIPTPAATQYNRKADPPFGQQTKRMFGVIPNFAAVSAGEQVPQLTSKGKFWLATQDSIDYSAFIWTGIQAGQSMALRSYPELGNGPAGYSRYYWRAFADQASGSYFTEAIVPALTHEDPRYYTRGHGGFFHRTAYALSRVVLTKTDSGGTSFNYSEIVGNGLEAGLSNLYYPPEERTFHNTALNWVSQLEAASTNNIVREFWPDIRRKLFRQK